MQYVEDAENLLFDSNRHVQIKSSERLLNVRVTDPV